MMIDRVDGADTGEPAERQADNEHVPADVPGSEGPLSRAGSRIGAIAANGENGENERPELVRPETVDGERGPDDRLPAPYAKWLDTPIADDQPTLREVLCRFAPAEAGLPEVTEPEAADYIAQNSRERPWLACLKECDPAVQRIAHPHRRSSRVDGHKYCSGYVLERVGGSLSAAQDCRSAWVDAKSDPDREPDVPSPRCAPVGDFAGATIEFFFRATRAKDGYEISTTYVEPPDSALRGG
jgi:hypothetical protein